jgi:hypothetical protein
MVRAERAEVNFVAFANARAETKTCLTRFIDLDTSGEAYSALSLFFIISSS